MSELIKKKLTPEEANEFMVWLQAEVVRLEGEVERLSITPVTDNSELIAEIENPPAYSISKYVNSEDLYKNISKDLQATLRKCLSALKADTVTEPIESTDMSLQGDELINKVAIKVLEFAVERDEGVTAHNVSKEIISLCSQHNEQSVKNRCKASLGKAFDEVAENWVNQPFLDRDEAIKAIKG